MLHLYPWECLIIISAGGSLVLVWHQVCTCTYTHENVWSSSVQVVVWCLFGTKSVPEPMLTYHQLDHEKHISVHLLKKFQTFSLIKIYFKTSFFQEPIETWYHQASNIACIKFRPQIISYPVDINMVQIFIVICCLGYKPLPIPCHSVSVITPWSVSSIWWQLMWCGLFFQIFHTTSHSFTVNGFAGCI